MGLVLRTLFAPDEVAFNNAIFEFGGAPSFLWEAGISFQDLLMRQYKMAAGVDLKEGIVPMVQYYGIVDGVIVGRLQLRTKITPSLDVYGGNLGYGVAAPYRRKHFCTEMVRQVLPIAWSLGLDKILVGCNEDNTASRKVIEKHGGILIDSIWNEMFTRFTRRYYIPKGA